MSARRFSITGPSGTRCGVYPGPDPLAAMALDAGCADVADWSTSTGVAPSAMRLAPVPEVGELCLLPGGLLGRVTGPAAEGRGLVRVERWAGDGWHAFGVEREGRLTVEGVEGHHQWTAAVGRAGDATIV